MRMRRQDRELDQAAARALLERGTWGVLATVDEAGQPYGVPVNYSCDGDSLLIHGAEAAGHRLGNVRANPRVSFTVVTRAELQAPQFTTAFESVIVFGGVEELTGEAKRAALLRFAARLGPDDPQARESYVDAAINQVALLRLVIDRMSGKSRPA